MQRPPVTGPFDSRRLEIVFNRVFADPENTLLRGGADEPLYQPAERAGEPHLLYYREDFFASALHEMAHWCIAGPVRRQQVDFGYWYAPEGRSPAQQQAFERVEVAPQALEWCLARACGYRFQVSVDNFGADGRLPDTRWFRGQVLERARAWQSGGLPPRASMLFTALRAEFGVKETLALQRFRPEDLGGTTSAVEVVCA